MGFSNYLGIENPVGLPVNRHLGRLARWGHHEGRREMHVDFEGRLADFERANLVTLQHIVMNNKDRLYEGSKTLLK